MCSCLPLGYTVIFTLHRGLAVCGFPASPAFVSQGVILQWHCSTAAVFQKWNGLGECGCASTGVGSCPCQSRCWICFQTLWRSSGLWSNIGWRRRRKKPSPLSSKHSGAVEVLGPPLLPSLLGFPVRLEAAENKWTLRQFSASHMAFVTLSYVMNKLTYARGFTCQRVICCTSM